MPKFAFTFGQAYNLHHNYIVIEADTEHHARLTFIEARKDVGNLPDTDRRWAFTYEWSRFEPQIDQFGLTEVPLDTPIDWRDQRNQIE